MMKLRSGLGQVSNGIVLRPYFLDNAVNVTAIPSDVSATYIPSPTLQPSIPWYQNKLVLIGGGVAALGLLLLIAKK